MCGIAGIVDYEAPPSSEEGVQRSLEMQRLLHHRGPDDRGAYAKGPVAFSHTRLAIIDRAGGAQPALSTDGRHVLVFNGEIYNHNALRASLDYRFTTRCDTETLLAGCILLGPDILPKLHGMFSFFYWDNEKQSGFAARDRVGINPFVYSLEKSAKSGDGKRFVFASEAKAIVRSRKERTRVHMPSLLEWALMPNFSGVAHTMFDDVEVLPPGCLLRVDRARLDAGLSPERWWNFVPAPESGDQDTDALARELGVRLQHAVTNVKTHADVPVGAYLSGGLDSTIVVAMARPIETFTIRFEEQAGFDYARAMVVKSDDSPFASLAAERLGVAQHWVDVSRDKIVPSIEHIARINDAIPAVEQEITQHHLARAASPKVRVILVGDAADETHYGYHFLLQKDVASGPMGLLTRFGAQRRLVMLHPRLREGHDVLADLAGRYRSLAEEHGLDWSNPSEALRATTYVVVRRFLARLLHNGDIHAMAYSLESRVPFADEDLLDFARRIPPEIGFRDEQEKWLLRRAAPPSLPDEIRWRTKSAMPKDQGVGDAYRKEVTRLLAAGDTALDSVFDVDALRSRLADTAPLTEVERSLLYQIIAFSHWSRAYEVALP